MNEYSAFDNVALAAQARTGHSYQFWSDARRDLRLASPAWNGLTRRLDKSGEVAVKEMSHGEQKQLELAIALATGPQMLLLDEPMAGLGTAECAQIIDLLRTLKRKVTILLVEHDMDAVFALADRVSVLVDGQRMTTGTGEQVINKTAVRIAYLGEGNI